jgi:hypothetical protein
MNKEIYTRNSHIRTFATLWNCAAQKPRHSTSGDAAQLQTFIKIKHVKAERNGDVTITDLYEWIKLKRIKKFLS